ncbi:hypothetical protein PFISCL1PPCAC_3179, partial [Pristionchus fissidentatus]
IPEDVKRISKLQLFLEASTIAPLLESLREFTGSKISFNNIVLSRDCDENEWKQISVFLLWKRPQFVRSRRFAIENSGIIDQQFLEEYVRGRNNVELILTTEKDEDEVPPFFPTRDIVSAISRFSKLWLTSMTLTTELLLEA